MNDILPIIEQLNRIEKKLDGEIHEPISWYKPSIHSCKFIKFDDLSSDKKKVPEMQQTAWETTLP